VYSLEPPAQDPWNDIMELHSVNHSTPLPYTRCALPGTWKWSCRRRSGLVVCAVCVISILSAMVAKFSFDISSGVSAGFRAGSVSYCCVAARPFLYCFGTEVHFRTTKATRNIGTFFVCKMFCVCNISNMICSVNRVVCWNCAIYTGTWELPRKGCKTSHKLKYNNQGNPKYTKLQNKIQEHTIYTINPLALELYIYSLANRLCKMWISYEPRNVTSGNTRHFVEE